VLESDLMGWLEIRLFLVCSGAAAMAVAVGAQRLPSFRSPDDYPRYPAAGSTYVPLDSWVYPALERLAARRYILSEFRGVRPWTRMECARQTDEAGEHIQSAIQGDGAVPEDLVESYEALEKEFAPELAVSGGERNRSVQMESVYTRVMSISGPELDDSDYFGQTISNDYGRPDRQGTDVIFGGAARATWGPFFAYADQEYQHAPSEPAYSASVANVVSQMNVGQPVLPHGGGEIDRLESLDTYAGVNFKNWQLSYGRQSLWWGPSESGPLLMSNNIAPLNVFRISRVVPFRLPSVLGFVGPIRIDFMVGKLGGHIDPVSPWIQNTRISFKMTDWFEFGISHAALFGGFGPGIGVSSFPNGLGVFFNAFFPINRLINQTSDQYQNKQYMSWDFNLRLSGKVTWYGEFLGSDDPYPFSEITRTAVNTGVYLSRLPWVSDKFDLRLEGVYTSTPLNTPIKPNDGFLHYWGVHWDGGYTNDGDIIGNAVGRDARRYGGWLTYHLSPKNSLQLNIAHTQVSPDFVPGGADWTDYRVNCTQTLRSGFYVSAFVQEEHLNYPVLFTTKRNNVTASVEFGYAFRSRPF
jgi:Capsule assembly protein Wzi